MKLTPSGTPLIGGAEGDFPHADADDCGEANKRLMQALVSGSVSIDFSNAAAS
ncbi:MAG: hypothetical protein R3E08_04505 [Thiotrichaceae bacterium]